ncbi:cysteine proteinase [Phellopilus nigrolimitatus]|nr:cysteine proteinase [Phellopilus nigrolimitatus]
MQATHAEIRHHAHIRMLVSARASVHTSVPTVIVIRASPPTSRAMTSNTPAVTDALYTKAARAELDADFDTAFTLYLSAAQAYLHHARALSADKDRDRARYKADAAKCLERAERIKAARKGKLAPRAKDSFSAEEQMYVLDRSAKVHGVRFPVWVDGAEDAAGEESDNQPPLGAALLAMSPVWRRPKDVHSSSSITLASPLLLPRHIRQNVVTDCSLCSAAAICLHHHRTFGSKLGMSCVFPQDTARSSILSPVGKYTLRFFVNGAFRKLVTERYAAQLLEDQLITLTLSQVSVDDHLPFYANERPISVTTAPDFVGFDLWPSLLEKAYMKLMGGYDFPGSNSSVDIHALTGWIPEHIEIKRRGSAYARASHEGVVQSYLTIALSGLLVVPVVPYISLSGSCVLTLGTGTGTGAPIEVHSIEGRRTRLLPTHSYAVLDVREDVTDDAGERCLTILDPWIASTDSGIEADSEVSDTTDALCSLRIQEGNEAEGGVAASGASLINLSWDVVCVVFDGIYLNWDPQLFRHQIEFHGSWRADVGASSDAPQCVHHHLTLNLDIGEQERGEKNKKYELCVLLTRHVVDKRHEGEFIAMHAVELDELAGEEGQGVGAGVDLALKVRLFGSWFCLSLFPWELTAVGAQGTYTSSTHTLTRLTLTDPVAQIALVASYDGRYADVCFTVQAFSVDAPLEWVTKSGGAAYERVIEGAFSARSAGGNTTYPTFMNNPQYRLRLQPDRLSTSSSSRGSSSRTLASREGATRATGKASKTFLRLVVEGPRNVPLNVMLVWRSEIESGERVIQLSPGDVVASSGAYSYGVAQVVASVAPGDYCIIVSAFEPRHRGEFTLRVESAVRADIDAIPAEGAGMFCKTVRGAWKPGSDGGSPRFGKYDQNPVFQIDVRTATPLKIRLQLTKPSPSIALNVSLYFAAPDISSPSYSSSHATFSGSKGTKTSDLVLGRQIATSGAYADGSSSPAGAVTPQVTVAPGRYLAVASTFDPEVHAEFQLHVFTKTDVQVASFR